MVKLFIGMSVCIVFMAGRMQAQDTLPRISVKQINNKVIVSWKNTYGARISNINIQRSGDSLKNFTTIGTILNPMNKENGYVDPKAPLQKTYYRVFVAFEGGNYVFTKSYRPAIDTTVSKMELAEEIPDVLLPEGKKDNNKPSGPPLFVPSKFVFTGKANNVIINLANAETRKLSIQFFDENENPLFEIKKITESYLILEKVNFIHAGWFKYHLYDDGVLLEKHKFFIPKDSKITDGREPRNR